jgi:nitrite reductase/ring-hydroxylating ferredoxin subunit
MTGPVAGLRFNEWGAAPTHRRPRCRFPNANPDQEAPMLEIECRSVSVLKADVPRDAFLTLDAECHAVALCRVESTFCAFHDLCPHEDWPLSDGYLIDGEVVCPLHGASFDPRTGEPRSGTACPPLRTYAVHEDGDLLYIDLEA